MANEHVTQKVVNVTDEEEAKSLVVTDIFTALPSAVTLSQVLHSEKALRLRPQIVKDLPCLHVLHLVQKTCDTP